jgi:hypothetical protein
MRADMIDNKHFTLLKDPAIDPGVRKHMQIISNEITRTLDVVDSIILTGSFGRGEGSVTVGPNGDVFPINDYDVKIITDQKVDEKTYSALVENLQDKVAPKTPDLLFGGAFSISVQFMSKYELSTLLPDVSTIDLKKASKVIFGEDPRQRIPFDCKDIPISSGIVLLFNKVVGMLEQVDASFLSGEIYRSRTEALVYQCTRAYMEMATVLLIMSGEYVPSYLEKVKVFARVYGEKFSQLQTQLPDLSDKIEFFTNLKLYSEFHNHKFDPIELWFSTRRDLLEVLKFYALNFYDIKEPLSDWDALVPMIHEKNSRLFSDYLSQTKLRGIAKFHPLLAGMQAYDSLRFFRKLLSMKRRSYMRVLLSRLSPLTNIYCASLFGLLSVECECSINEKHLASALRYLRQAYPCAPSEDLLTRWHNFRTSCVTAQKLYFLGRKLGV